MVKRLVVFLIGSAASQGLAALTGLLLTRWLSVPDYAIYTIMMALMGAMTLLTKGGTHLGYTAILSRDWGDAGKVDADNKAVKKIRREISLVIMPAIILATFVLLRKNHVEIPMIVLLCLFLCLSWFLDMQTRVIDQVLFFAHKTTKIQILDSALSGLRFFLTVGFRLLNILSLSWSLAFTVIIAGLRVPMIIGWVHRIIPQTENQPDPEDVKLIRRTAYRQMPTEIFTVFQTQIVLFILTLATGGKGIAAFGALSRIPQLLLPFQTASFAFFIPIFTQKKDGIVRALLLYTAVCGFPGVVLVAACWAFPQYVLLIIGPNYAHFQTELVISAFNASLFSAAQIFWNLIAHRGWNRFAWLQIPIGVAWCAAAPTFLPLQTLGGVLWIQFGFSLGFIISGVVDLIMAKRFDAHAH